MGRLEGRVAAITGSTRSIGFGMAEAFVREGAKVVLNGRSEAKGAEAMRALGGGDALAFFPGDAASQATAEGIVDFAVERFGQLDIMCLNSGGIKQAYPVMEMTDEEWQLEIDWNLNSVFWGMRKALQHMVPRGYGRILVTSSVEGKLGKPAIAGYTATKHAVLGLVKAAAHEVGTTGVTVNALLPGIVETDIVRETGPATAAAMNLTYDELIDMYCKDSAIKKPNTVEQVAAVAVMLASEAAANFTGCLFPIDGGTLPY